MTQQRRRGGLVHAAMRAAAGIVLVVAMGPSGAALKVADPSNPGGPAHPGEPGVPGAPIWPGDPGTCDPSRATCIKPCSALDIGLGRCPPGGGGGGVGPGPGGTCKPAPGGHPACGGDGPASLGGGAGGGVSIGGGNPINLLTGNKYQEEVDLPALPGVLGLEVTRHYNSQLPHAGLVGANWRIGYETVLYDVGVQIQVVQADGRRLVFQRGPGTQALCSSTRWQDGQVRIEPPSSERPGPVYHWRWPDGRTLTFAGGSGGGHPLQSITAATGQRLTLHYGPDGALVRVRDPQGRQLQLVYAPGGRWLEAVDTPLGRIRYVQDRLGRLREATRGDATRVYHYEDAHNGGHVNALTGISVRADDPFTGQPVESRVATYAYNAAGQAILSVRGRPRETKDGQTVAGTGIDQVELAFIEQALPFEGRADHRSGEVAPRHLGRTIVTNSLGQKTEVLHAVIGGQHRLLEMRGAGCANCGPAFMRYGWGAGGELLRATQLDADGHPRVSELIAYDRHGRVERIGRQQHASPGAPVEWTTRYAYADRHFRDGSIALAPSPSRVEQPSVVAGRRHTWRIEHDSLWRPLTWTEQGYSPLDEHGRAVPGGRSIERTVRWRYADVGGFSMLTEIDGPLPNGPSGSPADSDITRLHWDAQGRWVAGITQPLARHIELLHDEASGRLAATTGPGATGRRLRYANDGRLEAVEATVGGHVVDGVSVRRDAMGHVVELASLAGGSIQPILRQGVDIAGRLQWQADFRGVLRVAHHDTEGRPLASRVQTASMRQEERYVRDGAGHLERIEDDTGAVHRLVHDAAGRLAETIDPLGRITRFAYDDASRLVGVMQAVGTGQALSLQRGAADARGRQELVATTADGRRRLVVRRWIDDFGREVMSDSSDGSLTLRRHDEAGRVTQLQDAAGTIVDIVYDAAGRVVASTVTPRAAAGGIPRRDAEPRTTRYRYDGDRLVGMQNPQQDEAIEHDEFGRVVRRTVRLVSMAPAGRIESETRYRYDMRGQLVAASLPDGSELQYERNGQGQVVALRRRTAGGLPFGWGDEVLATDLQRDLVGLRHIVYGNGVAGRWQRSREGVLARVVYTRPHAAPPLWRTALEGLVGEARAAVAAPSDATTTLPGAFGLAPEPRALWDARLLFDAAGNVIAQSQFAEGAAAQRQHTAYLYDAQDQLAQAMRSPAVASPTVWRYHHDALGQRLLMQEQEPPSSSAHTVSTSDTLGAGRPPADVPIDAYGRLAELPLPDQRVARYRYDHRGLRIAKQVGGSTEHTLYDTARHRLADLDGKGRITRQYVWLADQLIAVIDLDEPRVPHAAPRTMAERVGRTIAAAWRFLAGRGERITYVHVNHLGAPVVMTDRDGRPVWSAEYAPFGRRLADPARLDRVKLQLRLPGQWEDEESGLHYNDQRYYDPSRGRYISRDPLGLAGGLDAYAYAGNNPLRYSDPRGLVLFAFDGTMNTDDLAWLHANGSSLSNVVRFRDLYLDGNRRYISGVGTIDRSDPTRPIDPGAYTPWYVPLSTSTADGAGNYSGPARIDRMAAYLGQEADAALDNSVMEIDIIGFSRGASQARDFANRITSRTRNGWYAYTDRGGRAQCQRVDFRFMGLWDTVLSTNDSGYAYNLAIPPDFAYVAHAVALNEYRNGLVHAFGSFGAFPLESIMQSAAGSPSIPGHTMIERGFVGAHADIGGGFGEEVRQLSDVALAWMVKQASAAGVAMNAGPSTIIASPVIHDRSESILTGAPLPRAEDRIVRYRNGTTTTQRAMTLSAGMSYIDTQQFIRYLPEDDPRRLNFVTGNVNMSGYLAWLNANGYDLGMTVARR